VVGEGERYYLFIQNSLLENSRSVGASLLANDLKFFASKLAPAMSFRPNELLSFPKFMTTHKTRYPVIPAKAGIQRCYSKCSWGLSRNVGLVGLTGFRPAPE
jgi:hypothetical protein